MSLLSLFLLWLHLTLSQEQWRLVHHDGSVEAVFGTPALTAQQRADLVSAWVWNRESPPRRVEPARLGQEHAVPAAGRLAVRVTRRAGSLPPADLRLVAAPREMWGAADEPSLPSWPVPKGGLLSLPWDPSLPWQLRVVGRREGGPSTSSRRPLPTPKSPSWASTANRPGPSTPSSSRPRAGGGRSPPGPGSMAAPAPSPSPASPTRRRSCSTSSRRVAPPSRSAAGRAPCRARSGSPRVPSSAAGSWTAAAVRSP